MWTLHSFADRNASIDQRTRKALLVRQFTKGISRACPIDWQEPGALSVPDDREPHRNGGGGRLTCYFQASWTKLESMNFDIGGTGGFMSSRLIRPSVMF